MNMIGGTIGMIAKGILLGCTFFLGITFVYIFPVYLQMGERSLLRLNQHFLLQ
ncbi:hypothetical protein ACI2OX_01730 [Bacillus sp. N9]